MKRCVVLGLAFAAFMWGQENTHFAVPNLAMTAEGMTWNSVKHDNDTDKTLPDSQETWRLNFAKRTVVNSKTAVRFGTDEAKIVTEFAQTLFEMFGQAVDITPVKDISWNVKDKLITINGGTRSAVVDVDGNYFYAGAEDKKLVMDTNVRDGLFTLTAKIFLYAMGVTLWVDEGHGEQIKEAKK